MDRLACVDVPALPLQLLLREHPDWRAGAVAVVAEDRPQAEVLYVNEAARRTKVLPGQRFAIALGLARELRAGAVSGTQVERSVAEIADLLRDHSPHVEPAQESPGVFWLDASGLGRLQPSLTAWANGILDALRKTGLEAAVVVGFTRFGTYAVSRCGCGRQVFSTPAEEAAAVRRVPLARLELDPDVRERLAALGVRTVGEFLDLPAGGIRRRFGEDAYRLHRLASGELWAPLVPQPPDPPRQNETELEVPEREAERLLFVIKRQLDALLAELAGRSEALAALWLHLRLDNHEMHEERLSPAAPTLDSVQILGLVRLRLETLHLRSGVVELRLKAEATRAGAEQIRLFAQQSRRDLRAAERAFARLRAEFGEDVVVRATLRDAHLPTARYDWERLTSLPDRLPESRLGVERTLVRRIYEKPIALPPRPRSEPDGWLLRGIENGGRVERLVGPYAVSGGWWAREVDREYYFAHMSQGDVLWIYYDRARRRFFLEGRVE